MPKQDVYYSPMLPERQSVQAVACLIYESAPVLFRLMFGVKSRAVSCLGALVIQAHNRFSHRYIRVAEENQQIVGMVVLIPASQLDDTIDPQTLPLPQRLWLSLLQRLLLKHLLRHDYPAGSFYIGNLAVAPEFRNRGIGRQLLSQCIAEAGPSDLFISVDVDNLRAQRLYESMGFQVVDAKTIRILNTTVGSRVLRLERSRK